MPSHFSYDESIVRRFLWATYSWALFAILIALAAALRLRWPSLGGDLPWLNHGYLQPLSNHLAVFGLVGNAVFCGVYYSTPRLCKSPMYSRSLSALHFWGWQAMLIAGAASLLLGVRQGRELAEFEWPIDLALAALWLIFALNFFGTLIRRSERRLYIALWFYSAAIVAFGIFHLVGNLALPVGLWDSYPAFGGIRDVLLQRWHANGVATFFVAVPVIGMMYYFLPKAAGRPVHSYRLSVVHLWLWIPAAILAGSHPSHYTPLPEWASTMGLLFGTLALLPLLAGVFNGLLSLRGAREKLAAEPALKFFVVALLLFGLTALEQSLFSLRWFHVHLGFTDWSAQGMQAGGLGWGLLMVFGVLYWMAPRVFQAPLHSQALATRHLWFATAGMLLTAVSTYAAGFAQSGMLQALSPDGQLLYPEFIETVERMEPFYLLRVAGSGLLMIGTLIGAYNVFLTWKTRPATYELEVHPAEPPPATEPMETRPEPTLTAVLETAKKWEVFSTLWWHRRGERQPLRFAAWTAVAVALPSAVQLAPGWLPGSTVGSAGVSAANLAASHGPITPYTPLELLGREVYVSEGCAQCHSQVVRRLWAETKRYDAFSEPFEFAFDYPSQWGTRRIGPDLARQGGRRSTQWLVQHLANPAESVPGSTMPAYAATMEAPLDLSSLAARMGALRLLGEHYTEVDVSGAAAHAEAQAADLAEVFVAQNGDEPYRDGRGRVMDLADRQGIALVAYLQRLGVDRFKEPEVPAANADTEVARGAR